jgi:hemerythrin-like domain-containing protein
MYLIYRIDKMSSTNKDKPEVTAVEDLEREHGLLNRVLLIYEEIIRRLKDNVQIGAKTINLSANIIRKFIEDYHEQTEEKFLFPELTKKGLYNNEVKELKEQHDLGRLLTDKILELTQDGIKDKDKLIECLQGFVSMYRLHESYEDTIIFPAFRDSLTKKEYEQYGETFEKDEEKQIGEGGFEKTLKIVEEIEKHIGIGSLQKDTERTKKVIDKII